MTKLDELREATGYDPDADGSVDDLIAYKDALEDAYAADARALDRINVILSEPSWSVGMLEDFAAIVADTGREPVPREQRNYVHH